MPFPFSLPTTSRLTFQSHFTSTTHPSLPAAATAERNVLYSALKAHKRLPDSARATNLQNVLGSLERYLPYALTIDAGLSGKAVAGEEVHIALTREIEVEWRTTLASSIVPGLSSSDGAKIKGRGLDYEIYFALHTLAMLHTLTARAAILGLYAATTPTADQRLAIIQSASKALTTAFAIHEHLRTLSTTNPDGPPSFPPAAIDIAPTTQSALSQLTSAEIALAFVLKDDPYPAIVTQARNKADREWMIKAPDIPKLRAQVLARLCLGAADRAAAAATSLQAEPISKDLITYAEDLRRTCRARGCRFLALDADVGGETGRAIAFLHAGLSELGLDVPSAQKKPSASSGLSKLKSSWSERREDKRLERGGVGGWGMDGGRAEEGRVLVWLEARLSKMNDTVNVQLVPDWRPLLGALPSGRDVPAASRPWTPPLLGRRCLREREGLWRLRLKGIGRARAVRTRGVGSEVGKGGLVIRLGRFQGRRVIMVVVRQGAREGVITDVKLRGEGWDAYMHVG